jgi:hypothetical protein
LEGCFCPFIRYLACSNEWQLKFGLTEDSKVSFFKEPVIELDVNKTTFLHYLIFYKRIYELDYEKKPEDYIIKNRFLCDEWLRLYMAEIRREQRKLNTNSLSSNKKSDSMQIDF